MGPAEHQRAGEPALGPALPGVRGILANAGWLYLDQGVRATASLVTFGFIARALGPTGFGVLSYALAFPGIFLPLAALGLDYVLVQEFVRQPDRQAAIFSTGLGLKSAGTASALVLCSAAGFWLVPAETPAKPLLIVTGLSLALQPAQIIDCCFQSRIASKHVALARMGANLVANGVRVWMAVTSAPLLGYAWAYVLEAVLLTFGLIRAYRVQDGWQPFQLAAFSPTIARRLIAEAWPLFLADVAIAIYLRLNQVLLEHLAGADALGRYAAAMRVADALEFLPLAVIGSYFPHIVALHQERKEGADPQLRRFFSWMTWLAILLAAGVTLTGRWVVGVVMGAQFVAAIPLLVALVWANVFATQVAVRGRWFLARGLQVYTLLFFALGAVVHLALLFLLAPTWGAVGAAAAYLISQTTMALVLPFAWRKSRPAGQIAWASLVPL